MTVTIVDCSIPGDRFEVEIPSIPHAGDLMLFGEREFKVRSVHHCFSKDRSYEFTWIECLPTPVEDSLE